MNPCLLLSWCLCALVCVAAISGKAADDAADENDSDDIDDLSAAEDDSSEDDEPAEKNKLSVEDPDNNLNESIESTGTTDDAQVVEQSADHELTTPSLSTENDDDSALRQSGSTSLHNAGASRIFAFIAPALLTCNKFMDFCIG